MKKRILRTYSSFCLHVISLNHDEFVLSILFYQIDAYIISHCFVNLRFMTTHIK
jgi:hypothetical protein